MKKNKGGALIELMIVIILELLLLSFLVEIYVGTQGSYQLQTKLNDLQENAKIAIRILNAEIQRAGYIGCQRLTRNFPAITYPPYFLSKQNRLTGNGNEIIIRRMGEPHTVLNETMSNQRILYTSNEVKFDADDILMIADCKHAEIFQVGQVRLFSKSQKIISVQPLRVLFTKNAEIGKLEINKFFIATTKRKDSNGKLISSLFLENIKQSHFELVEGIEALNFKYIILQQGKLHELTFDQIKDWSKVKGVAVELGLAQAKLYKTWYSYVAIPFGYMENQ